MNDDDVLELLINIQANLSILSEEATYEQLNKLLHKPYYTFSSDLKNMLLGFDIVE